ncbi:dienelactone hydrolase family protein [Micromonospora sp. NBC_01638]|uniref:dienelactone hydrolase family protein n=1 Tax=Micromonospora sp. NBC_01638 TaxID=2975982 RepID=UPI0038686DF2|nr:dienelactone hydrolase family protein [Micromonospora sp. NBC_01638]
MQTTTVDIPTGDGVADACLTRLDGNGPFPAVLLFMDAFGPRPRLVEMAERIAARGYLVLTPHQFYRGGRSPLFDLSRLGEADQRAAIFAKAMPLIGALTADVISRDTAAYLDFLAARSDVRPGPVAITGYCMGGTNALRAIEAHPDRIATIASFHGGRFVTDAPDSPHLGVDSITGEVYFGHADEDQSMTPEQIATLEKALDAASVRHRSEVYEGAHHGFTMADTPAYDQQATERHWAALFDLLDRTLPTT